MTSWRASDWQGGIGLYYNMSCSTTGGVCYVMMPDGTVKKWTKTPESPGYGKWEEVDLVHDQMDVNSDELFEIACEFAGGKQR